MSKELNKAPVEQAGGDERDFQAKGAQEVPSPVSKEYDRHLISLLRKGEALPGHQEEAADEIERLRDWNDHLNNTVLPNILNPNFLMLMKGGERLLDLCTKDGEFIGVSLNDMKDVFDWMVTHARIAPDQAALAQPSPAQAEQAEVVAWRYGFSGGIVSDKACLDEWKSGGEYQSLMTVAQHERIVGALRFERQQMDRAFTACINERDAANARLHEVATACATAEQERDAALARVAELERQQPVAWMHDQPNRVDVIHRDVKDLLQRVPGSSRGIHRPLDVSEHYTIPLYAAPVAQAQHSVPEISGIGRDAEHPRAVVLYLRNEPSDEDMRAIQNFLRAMPADVSAKAQHSVPEGWKLVPIEPLFNMMSDKDHDTRITAERQLLSILADAPGNLVPQAWLDVQAERRRQNTAEGWTPEHDDLYCAAELPRAAAAYILNGANDEAPAIWPFSAKWWKPRDARSNYVRAGALILAEIERLDRARQGGRS
ncbi:TPA: hypothetical protein ACXIFE_002574 [Pseudomonas aeruginosa]